VAVLHPPDRLMIPLFQVRDDAVDLEGELAPSALELDEDDRLAAPNPLRYQLRAQMAGADLLVAGHTSMVLRARCDRCLAYHDHEVRCDEVCHYLEAPTTDTVDVTPLLREDLLLQIPQKLLCQPECRGLCPQCGRNLNTRACECRREPPSSATWASLDGLKL